MMGKIANSIGGKLIHRSYGHYEMSGFIKKNDKYVYFSYDNSFGFGGRTHCLLKNNGYSNTIPLLIRTAKNEFDYTGGDNNYRHFKDCVWLIERLLN